MSLSASIVSQRFFMNCGTSYIATLLLITYWFSARTRRWSRRRATSSAKSSGSSSFEGRKNASSLKRSTSWICSFPGGFLMLSQAYWTLENIFYLSPSTFSLPLQKSRTTKMIFFGSSVPNSRRLSSRMISRMATWDPLYNPICWIHRLMRRVWDIARANREFLL